MGTLYYNFDNDDEHLEHHGVKGMKWGVRKSRNTNTRQSKSSRDTRKKQAVKRAAAFVASSVLLTVTVSKVSKNRGAIRTGHDYVINNPLNDTSWAEAAWKEVE